MKDARRARGDDGDQLCEWEEKKRRRIAEVLAGRRRKRFVYTSQARYRQLDTFVRFFHSGSFVGKAAGSLAQITFYKYNPK